jgi:hypothetical protein
MIYNWLTEETAPILLKFIDDQFQFIKIAHFYKIFCCCSDEKAFHSEAEKNAFSFFMKYEVKSRYGGINNGEMKLISFTKGSSIFTIVIDKTGIKHSKELVELEGIEAFVLQEIRNEKLEDLGV